MSTLAHPRRLVLQIVICLFACALLSAQEPAASPGTLLQQAIALHKAGDLEGAIRAYREYLAAEPDSVQARSNLGAALAGTGRYEEAIAEYAHALQQSPDNPALLLNLRTCLFQDGPPRRSRRPLRAGRLSHASVQGADHALARRLLQQPGKISRKPRACWARSRKTRPAIRDSTFSMEPRSSAMAIP